MIPPRRRCVLASELPTENDWRATGPVFPAYGYSHHGRDRSHQRWMGRGRPPTAQQWSFAFAVPRASKLFQIRESKGRQCIATRDALAVVSSGTIVTVIWVGWETVDDLRATVLCRAMGLPIRLEVSHGA